MGQTIQGFSGSYSFSRYSGNIQIVGYSKLNLPHVTLVRGHAQRNGQILAGNHMLHGVLNEMRWDIPHSADSVFMVKAVRSSRIGQEGRRIEVEVFLFLPDDNGPSQHIKARLGHESAHPEPIVVFSGKGYLVSNLEEVDALIANGYPLAQIREDLIVHHEEDPFAYGLLNPENVSKEAWSSFKYAVISGDEGTNTQVVRYQEQSRRIRIRRG